MSSGNRRKRDREERRKRARQRAGEFNPLQPKDGDRILHCGHLNSPPPFHWMYAPAPMRFRRPDGTEAEAHWVVACGLCRTLHGKKVEIRGDGVWQGDAPIVTVND